MAESVASEGLALDPGYRKNDGMPGVARHSIVLRLPALHLLHGICFG